MALSNSNKRKKQKLAQSSQNSDSLSTNKSSFTTYQDSDEVPTDTEEQPSSSLPSISFSNNRPVLTNESIRYSQNLTIDSQFGPDLNKFVIKPNDNISKRINQIFKLLTSHTSTKEQSMQLPVQEVELLLISKNEGIQKLVTIVEIVKQKLNNVPKQQKTKKSKRKASNGNVVVKNDRLAKFDNQKSIVIGTTKIENMPEYQYKQFNFLDYTTIQRSELRSKKEEKRKRKLAKVNHTEHIEAGDIRLRDDFNKDHLAVLEIDKTISLPVMYTYLNFSLYDDNAPVRLLKRFDDLIKDGWSLQEQ